MHLEANFAFDHGFFLVVFESAGLENSWEQRSDRALVVNLNHHDGEFNVL